MTVSNKDIDLLAPLVAMATLSRGLPGYFIQIAEADDPVLRVAAWRALMEARAVPETQYRALLADCTFGGVRGRAFDYFESLYEHGLACQAADTPVPDSEQLRQAAMRASVAGDSAALAAVSEQLFLATGDLAHLSIAADAAEVAGWRPGLAITARAFAAFPQSVPLVHRLIRLVETANQAELARALGQHFAGSGVYAHVAELFNALAALTERDNAECLSRLDRLTTNPALAGAIAPFLTNIKKLRGEALDRQGEYRAAHAAFAELNALDRALAKGVDPAEYFKGPQARAKVPIPPLPPDKRSDTVWMLGFPRSGTTLLENALAAHPSIETFEEIPSLNAAIDIIERTLLRKRPKPAREEDLFLGARERFYAEIDLRRRKPEATVLVDKLPLRSGDAIFAVKLFPEQRHIFSIRHPFDVAISCFRQRFTPNPAMENFHSIADVARIYDFVLSEWFAVHRMDSPNVHYVRYEELVPEFERVTRGVLGFLGLEWDEAIRSFAERAEARSARTPSYQKVRQGLSVGVQTYWRNYGFLFQSTDVKPLHKWAEFFGYPTK